MGFSHRSYGLLSSYHFQILGFFLLLTLLSALPSRVDAKFEETGALDDIGYYTEESSNLLQRNSEPTKTPINCTKHVEDDEITIVCEGETFYPEEEHDKPGSPAFFRDIIICAFLVLTAGMMSGLTLGLLGMDLNTLEIYKRHGTPKEQLYASRILPIVKKHHLLLVTLLLANAGAMEALPIFLEHLVPGWLAIIISVTAVLFFGEIIPQAILSRWALEIGGTIYWFVWGLIYFLFPLSWPISKVLDWILGHKQAVYYKRAQLKEFVSYHAASAFNGENANGVGLTNEDASSDSDDGGLPKEERLTNDEVMIIKGALDLTSKNVTNSMTPLDKVFSLSESTVIDPSTLQAILDSGHSRIPLWRDHPSNLVGMLLVKTLNLNFILEGGTIARADIKELPLVDSTTPLYTMLNIFQTGRSHMAGVLGAQSHQAIGIITLEDIIEELIQEEIEDEMDIWRREHIRVRKVPSRRASRGDLSLTGSGAHMERSKSSLSTKEEQRSQRRRTRKHRENALGIAESDSEVALRIHASDSESRRRSVGDFPPARPETDTEMVELDLESGLAAKK